MLSNETQKLSSTREPWIAYLEEEIEEEGEDSPVSDLNIIMRGLLSSTSDTAPADAAREFDEYYSQKFLLSDPLMKFSDDKGMEAYLWALYELVFSMSRLIPYNDTKQTKLAQLLVELRKLPPKTSKIWNTECLVYTKDPIFGAVMEENWNANRPSTAKNVGHGAIDSNEYKEACEEYVNYSGFTARCIQAGVFDRYDDRGSKFPSFDVSDGLEKDSPDDVNRDWKVKVAAQYVILAGQRLHEYQTRKPAKPVENSQWWQGKWQLWPGKFEALSDGYEKDGKTEMAAMTREAHDVMLALSKAPAV